MSRSRRPEHRHAGEREESLHRDRAATGSDADAAHRRERVATLQRYAGNQAIQRLHETGAVPGGLEISRPGDAGEREAERVADAVTTDGSRTETDTEPAASTTAPRARAGRDGDAERELLSVDSGGRRLPKPTRSYFERRFGRDFGDVRVHTGRGADETARALGARAFTYGSDVAFRRGQYRPRSNRGRRLLAHELTHVVEQTADAGSRAGQSGGLGEVTVRTRTGGEMVQRGLWGAAAEALSQPFENMVQPGGSFGGIPNPLASVFDSVATASIASASGISIPDDWWSIVRDYATSNPADGAFLLPALARGPSFWRGGWILSTQPRAAAMTLDDDEFVDGTLPLSRFVHELVHVTQYSTLGKMPFLTTYFGMAAGTIAKRWAMGQKLEMMKANPHEIQGYAIERRFTSWFNSQSSYSGTASSRTV